MAKIKESTFIKAMANAYKLPKPRKPSGSLSFLDDSHYFPPELYLKTNDYPGIKDFDLGEEVTLVIKAKVVSKSSNYDNDDTQRAQGGTVETETRVSLSLSSIAEIKA